MEKELLITAPNNLPIVGVKLINGDVGNCKLIVHDGGHDLLLPKRVLTENGKHIFIDSDNNEWALSSGAVMNPFLFP